MFYPALLLLSLLCAWSGAATADASSPDGRVISHILDVRLDPTNGAIELTDQLQWSGGDAHALEFFVHPSLEVKAVDGRLEPLFTRPGHYRLMPASHPRRATIRLSGSFNEGLRSSTRSGYDRGIQSTRGRIAADGVYLGPESLWYPDSDGALHRYDLRVEVPTGWTAMSSGSEVEPARFRETHTLEGIWLIAGRFSVYRDGRAAVYLRTPDADLAARYLQATRRYLDEYEALLGPYPYARFSLVENTWESGFGMPAFTLLGPRVIRLPFILHSSYPHEILHNWWGNGVYVDMREGNWSEGLTTYLADHHIQQQRGQGPRYRRRALQRYADLAAQSGDFPLSRFRFRHNNAAQAVGYGKAMMLFHMLRQRIGDTAFIEGLRHFYTDERFRFADYADLQRHFERVSGQDLSGFFVQWVQREGAPILDARVVDRPRADAHGHSVTLALGQAAPKPYSLDVVIAVALANGETVLESVRLDTATAHHTLGPYPDRPTSIQVDPYFDLFRVLAPGEAPLTLNALFGADEVLILLPSLADAAEREAYTALAQTWAAGNEHIRVARDTDVARLPEHTAVWLLGDGNRHLTDRPGAFDALDDASTLVTTLPRNQPGAARGWLRMGSTARSEETARALARRLLHYGSYSYLVFEDPRSRAGHRGEWPATGSPLLITLEPAAAGPVPPPRSALRPSGEASRAPAPSIKAPSGKAPPR
ncbi:MAG: M1 family metallopeptidase [Gammaproteobacteria bacterium]